ncbi:hypothetical protein V8C34DRAFT_98556 [Trichoderma compactum]
MPDPALHSAASVACVYSRSVLYLLGTYLLWLMTSTGFRPFYFNLKDQHGFRYWHSKIETEPRRRAMTISQNSYRPSSAGRHSRCHLHETGWHTPSGTARLAHDFCHGKAEPVLSEALILIIATTAFLRLAMYSR